MIKSVWLDTVCSFFFVPLCRKMFNIMKKTILSTLLVLCVVSLAAQQQMQRMRRMGYTGEVLTHDPVMAWENDTCYLYSTGGNIQQMTSTDMRQWKYCPSVFRKTPEWAMKRIPGYRGHTWAPDIVRGADGRWHLYYSCSSFGKNTSAIGHAWCTSLSKGDWTDTGMVVESGRKDRFNAIDPAVVLDDEGRAWMSFGSFWNGIQLVRLSADMTAVDKSFRQQTIASRPKTTPRDSLAPVAPGSKAIEAPFIYRHDGWYYLFVSWDYCCRGLRSNYKVVVGRSRTPYGPYLDRYGVPMAMGGGTLLYDGDEQYVAGGHSAAYTMPNGRSLFICHGYSREHEGESYLVMKEMTFTDGWPVLKDMKSINAPYYNEPFALWPAASADCRILAADWTERQDDGNRFNRVVNPTLEAFPALSPDNRPRGKRRAVVVCPGGAYQILAYEKEGQEVAMWLQRQGYDAYVLAYTVPGNREQALRDVQRAVRVARQRGADEVGVIGFSAGASLSARACTRYDEQTYTPVDYADTLSCRPDFGILIYPAYLDEGEGQTLSPELRVTADTPPMFVFGTQDDVQYSGPSCMTIVPAMQRAGAPVELHYLPRGGHGYGMRRGAGKVWPTLCEQWLSSLHGRAARRR